MHILEQGYRIEELLLVTRSLAGTRDGEYSVSGAG